MFQHLFDRFRRTKRRKPTGKKRTRSTVTYLSRTHSSSSTNREKRRFQKLFPRFLEWVNGLRLGRFFRWTVLAGLLFAGMAGFIAFALFTPYFEVQAIRVVRTDASFDVQKVQAALQEYVGKNMLFVSSGSIEATLLQTFPELETVTITEAWPNTIEISVTVFAPAYTLQNLFDATKYVLSEQGVVLRRWQDEILPEVQLEQYNKSLSRGMRVIPSKEVQSIQSVEQISREVLGYIPSEMRLLWAAQELHVTLEDRIVVWLDLNHNIPEQFEKLINAAGEIELETRSFEHIDLRIPGSIFWKYR